MLRNKLRFYILNNQSGLKKAIQEIEDSCCAFNGDRVVTREGIPNINVGGIKLREFIENYFFPPIPPVLFISVFPNIKEYGDFADADIHWSVTKKTLGITQIIIDAFDLGPDYPNDLINEDADEFNAVNEGDLVLPVYLGDGLSAYTFYMYVKDTLNNTFPASATLNFLHKRIWLASATNLFALNDTDLSVFLNLGIAPVGVPPYVVNSELATNLEQERTITCNNEYLCFLWPMSFGEGEFNVNDFDVNLWQVRDVYYVNTWGAGWAFRIVQSWFKLYGTYQIKIN